MPAVISNGWQQFAAFALQWSVSVPIAMPRLSSKIHSGLNP
jgi:hypothetical protein